MKCVVFAYHNIGCAAINELLEAGYEISAVFTHQDSKNENIWFDSVAELTVSKGRRTNTGNTISAAFREHIF